MATPLEYCIQFRPCACKDSVLQQYENIGLDLATSAVANLVSKLPVMQISNYHIVTDIYFTSLALLRHLSAMGVPATGTVRANRIENATFRDMVKRIKRSVDHQMWLLICPQTSLQHVGKIIKSWIRFPPLLVNNQLNRSTVIVIVKNGEWILNN